MTKTTAAPYDWINIGVSSTSNTNAMTKMDYTFIVTDFSGDNCCVSNLAYNDINIDQDWNTNYEYSVAGSTTGNVLTINLSMVLLPWGTPQNLSGTTDLLKIRFLVNPGCNLVIAMTKNEFTNNNDLCVGSPLPSNISISAGSRSVSGNIKMKVHSTADINFVDNPIAFNTNSGCCNSIVSNTNGNFSCNSYSRTDYVIVTPNQVGVPSAEFICGVDSDDLAAAQSFILNGGNIAFSEYFQVIACDMNRNNSVTALDLSLLSALINETYPTWAPDPGYRYTTTATYTSVPGNYFGNPQNPLILEEEYQAEPGSTPIDDANFFAIKLGDCDNGWCLSYDFNNFSELPTETRGFKFKYLKKVDYKVDIEYDTKYTIVRFMLDGINQIGFNSFSINLNNLASKFEFIKGNEKFAYIDYNLDKNVLQGSMGTDAYFSLNDNEPLFQLVFKGRVQETDIISNMLLEDHVFKNLLFLNNEELRPIIEVKTNELSRNNIIIYPSIISSDDNFISLSNNNLYTKFKLTDINGSIIDSGLIDNNNRIRLMDISTKGVMFLCLYNDNTQRITKKIIKI